MVANVHTANRQHERVLDLISAEQPDVILFMEVNQRWLAQLDALRDDYPHVVADAREDNFGIAFYSRIPTTDLKVEDFGDSQIPSVIAQLNIADEPVTVIGTHPLPPMSAEYSSNRNRQLEVLGERLKKLDAPVVVLGDLNATPWSPVFRDLIDSSQLMDTRVGQGLFPTWPSKWSGLGIPIDHALVSDHFRVEWFKSGERIGSDHLPLIIEIGLRGD